MAQIPQINNPITAKNYNYSPRQQDAGTEPFDIVKLTAVGGAGGATDAGGRSRLEMGNRELIPMAVQVKKDPTLAVETLKDIYAAAQDTNSRKHQQTRKRGRA